MGPKTPYRPLFLLGQRIEPRYSHWWAGRQGEFSVGIPERSKALELLDDARGQDHVPALDPIDGVHPGNDTSENGVLPVQMRGGDMGDEELDRARVEFIRTRHPDCSAIKALGIDLGTSREVAVVVTGAVECPALDDEVGDHPVKGRAVVTALGRQAH